MTETVKISPDNTITLSAEALALLGVKAGVLRGAPGLFRISGGFF